MKRQQETGIVSLLTEQRILSLAVVVGKHPVVGLVPYAMIKDFSGLLIHVSRLARHGNALQDGAPVGILIHQQDQPDLSALQLARISLQGTAHTVQRTDTDYGPLRRLYRNRFPESSITFQLGDFELYRIRFEGGHYVGGFASAVDLSPKDIAALANEPQGE
jgi:putative heme iron utilization protein